MNNHPYLVLERSSQNLKTIGDSKKTILEGIFAEFGIENRNGRIYNESTYLKHLEYLKKDIADGVLLGELDHPDRYEVSLGNASHRIIELWYEPSNRRVMGRIEILENTPKGQIAKALLDAGVQLSISSRAAGTVNPDKTVQIHQIYTYDLVIKPGFASAQLYTVKESLNNKAFEFYKSINESQEIINNNITKNLGIETENITILDISENCNLKIRTEALNIINDKNNNKDMNNESKDTITIEEYNKLNERVENLQAIIESFNTKIGDANEIANIKEYVNELRTIQECALNWQADIATGVNKVASYIDEVSKKSNKHINATKKLSEAINHNADVVNKLQEWTSSIATTTNFLAETVDYNAEVTNHMQEWASTHAKAINEMHSWTSDIANKLNGTMNYTQDMFGRAISKNEARQILEYVEALVNKEDTTDMKIKLSENLTSTSINGIEVITDQKPIKQGKQPDTGTDKGVKFDDKTKTITAKGTKVTLTKGKLPNGLSTLDNKEESTSKVSVSGKPNVKGLEIMDDVKQVKKVEVKDAKSVGNYVDKQQLANLPSTKGKKETKVTNESFDKSNEISDRQNSLIEKLSLISQSLEKQRALVEQEYIKYPFVKMLSESDKQKFYEMSVADKEKVNNEMNKINVTDARVVQNIWESAIKTEISQEPLWIVSAPAKYREMYENASQQVKNSIKAKSEFFNLNTQYQIDNFWENSGLSTDQKLILNESVVAKPLNAVVDTVSDDYINNIGKIMQRYK